MWKPCPAVTEPQTNHTVIYTQHFTAARLHDMRLHLPLSSLSPMAMSAPAQTVDGASSYRGWSQPLTRWAMPRAVAAVYIVADAGHDNASRRMVYASAPLTR